MTLKDTLDKVSEEIVMLKNENTKLREKVCTCSSTTHRHPTQTPEADVVNKVNELFKSQNKRFAEIIDRRITNSNRNINTIQLENKHIRNQLLAINENKTTVTDDINKLKSKIAVVATASESNRQRLIEIERTISSEFYPAHIPPPSENTPNRNNLTQNESPVNESHNQQDERHESSAKSTLDLLIIGSSIMRYIDAKKIEKRNPETSRTVCIPGGKIRDIIDNLQEIKKNHTIKKIIIHVGANHIPEMSPQQIIENMSKMYKDIRNMFPSTKIFNSAMIPRRNNDILYALNYINNKVELYCRTLKINTIKHPQFGVHELNCKILKRDLIHPTFNGMSIIARNMIAVYRNYHSQPRS